ncbi:nucleoporin Nup43 [Scaptodrosophila lebanonensis]|uniref:Nucleoporin Nup43 n=1 Tax=Drosophila lebanonensis TaxID=7225 RepID=A0A6J2T5M9_DROLE|nr:nucleoporin Nup43 [Scaptodrosophila lebanonensis]
MTGTNAQNVTTYYISEKVSQVRWLPELQQQSDRFVTGSWDIAKNYVRLWRLQQNPYVNQNVPIVPCCHDKVSMEDDVTGMEFVDKNTLAVGCGDGHLSVLKVQRAVEKDQIQRKARSELLHYFKSANTSRSASCTGVATFGTDIATVGDDGRLNVVNADNLQQVKRTIEADSVSLFAVVYANHQEIFTANGMGVVRMFDARASNEAQPNIAFVVGCQDEKNFNGVSCMTTHPMQKHILLCGSEEGSISVYDLRNLRYPASYLGAHNSRITDIAFHPKDPTKLFTAAESGEVWLWSEQKSLINASEEQEDYCAWLCGERVSDLVKVKGVLSNVCKPINSIDVHGMRLVCGSDAEIVFLADNV